jgi:aspartate-semialdehyde dehydrogenase
LIGKKDAALTTEHEKHLFAKSNKIIQKTNIYPFWGFKNSPLKMLCMDVPVLMGESMKNIFLNCQTKSSYIENVASKIQPKPKFS